MLKYASNARLHSIIVSSSNAMKSLSRLNASYMFLYVRASNIHNVLVTRVEQTDSDTQIRIDDQF